LRNSYTSGHPSGAGGAHFSAPPALTYYRAGVTRESHRYEVLLNGQILPLCIEASTTPRPLSHDGWAKVYCIDAVGDLRRDIFDRAVTQTLEGRVEIRRVEA
jgi:hypothetical protein